MIFKRRSLEKLDLTFKWFEKRAERMFIVFLKKLKILGDNVFFNNSMYLMDIEGDYYFTK
jgi:hypothetical protein